MWAYSSLDSRASLAPLPWSNPLSLYSQCPGCSVRTFHFGWLELKTILCQSWNYSACLLSSLTSWSIILCMWNLEFSKSPKETHLQDLQLSLCSSLHPVLCPVSLLQPSSSPELQPLSLSPTRQGCQALPGVHFLHCGLEFVSRQKAGAVISLTLTAFFPPGIRGLYKVQK